MSHNKDIKFFHQATGKSYAECRRILKSNKWNVADAVWQYCGLDNYKDALIEAADNAKEAFAAVADAASQVYASLLEVFKSIDWEEVAKYAGSDISDDDTVEPENEEEQPADPYEQENRQAFCGSE